MAEESVAEATVETPAEQPAQEKVDEGQKTDEGQTETAEATAEKPKEEPKPVEKRKYKYKANGKEIEAELSDTDVLNALSKAAGADASFEEAAKVKKQIIQLFEEGAKSPEQLLTALKIDPRKFAEELLYKIYSEEQMPEAERRALQAERKAAQLEAEKKALEDANEKAVMDSESAKWTETYDKQITDALEKSTVKLPKTPETVKRIAGYMLQALEKGIDVPVDDIIPLVYEDMQGGIGSVLSAADEDTIIKLLGEDKARAIAKKIATQVPTPGNRASQETKPEGSSRRNTKKTWKQLEAELDAVVGK